MSNNQQASRHDAIYNTYGSGLHHWWHQRFSAIVLALLTIYMAYLCCNIIGQSLENIYYQLSNPWNFTVCVMFIIFSMYHGTLGMQVVIEDYVSYLKFRYFLLIILKLFALITAFSGITALLFFIFLD